MANTHVDCPLLPAHGMAIGRLPSVLIWCVFCIVCSIATPNLLVLSHYFTQLHEEELRAIETVREPPWRTAHAFTLWLLCQTRRDVTCVHGAC